MSIDDCSSDERRIINSLSKNDKIMQFIADTKKGVSTQEEITEYLQTHMSVLTELLGTVLSDPALSSSLGITKDFLPKITERITPDDVYNYRDDDTTFQDFARINGVNADTDEIGLTMLHKSPAMMSLTGPTRSLILLIRRPQSRRKRLLPSLCLNRPISRLYVRLTRHTKNHRTSQCQCDRGLKI